MIRRLTILLLIVGCEEDTPTESSVQTIEGIWQWAYTTSITQDYHQGQILETITNDNNFEKTYTFNTDGTYIYASGVSVEGNWTTSSNTLTLLSDGNSVEYNYSINNNNLLISYTNTTETQCTACQSSHSETITIQSTYTKQ